MEKRLSLSYLVAMNQALLIAENKALKAENAHLQFRLEQLERLIFGQRRERFIPQDAAAEQLSLFQGEAPDLALVIEPDAPEKQVVTYERDKPSGKPHPGRNKIPDHFPEDILIIEPDEDTTGLVKIGEERTEYVEYTPASLVKRVIIRPKYAQPRPDETTKVLIGTLPSRPIDKGLVGPGFLAHIVTAKFVDHLPFHRQIQRFARDYRWTVHKNTMNDWFVAVCTLLEPLYALMVKSCLSADYLQADESRINVLTHIAKDKSGQPIDPEDIPEGSKRKLGWMWVVHNPLDGTVVFNYEDNRSQDGADGLLAGFTRGYLQVDGYDGYNHIVARPGVQRVGCLAHVRRKFFDARSNDPKRADFALKLFQDIYRHERLCENLTAEERLAHRLQHVQPLLAQFKKWLDLQAPYTTPKSPIGMAMTYAQNQYEAIAAILYDGRIRIDNNLIENKIRTLALGRKNYLFAGSHQGAQRIAMMYSFFATCKAHNVNPFEWLLDTLQRIPDTKISQLHTLLPGYQQPRGEV